MPVIQDKRRCFHSTVPAMASATVDKAMSVDDKLLLGPGERSADFLPSDVLRSLRANVDTQPHTPGKQNGMEPTEDRIAIKKHTS